MNEHHVIFGSGPVGRAVTDSLIARGKQVTVVKRSGHAEGLPQGVQIVKGDATDANSAREVCKGASHVYNCTNPKDYHKWPEQFPPLQAGVLAGAIANNAKYITMENLYMYGPHDGIPMTEDMPMRGEGSRSTTRKQMAIDLMAAHNSGKVQALAVRASDFYGPRVEESLVGARVFRPAVQGKSAQYIAELDVKHTFTYVPDVGEAMVILAEHDEAYGQAWHVPNAPTLTPREFITMIYRQLGMEPKIGSMPRFIMRLVPLFMPPLRGISENDYMYYEPYIVDHSKFDAAYGHLLQPTPYEEGIRAAIEWYRANLAPNGQ